MGSKREEGESESGTFTDRMDGKAIVKHDEVCTCYIASKQLQTTANPAESLFSIFLYLSFPEQWVSTTSKKTEQDEG